MILSNISCRTKYGFFLVHMFGALRAGAFEWQVPVFIVHGGTPLTFALWKLILRSGKLRFEDSFLRCTKRKIRKIPFSFPINQLQNSWRSIHWTQFLFHLFCYLFIIASVVLNKQTNQVSSKRRIRKRENNKKKKTKRQLFICCLF